MDARTRPHSKAGKPAKASPVMAQFFAAKEKAGDALVFFRMGDFYELFFDDAKAASAAIGITLTSRGVHEGAPIPMAGVPAHAAEGYLAKLIRAGFKVAICEQMEDPAEARRRGSSAIVRRETVRVVTPGTLTEETLLDGRGANRLAALARRAGQWAVAAVELSTGEVECGPVAAADLGARLAALQPSETLVGDRWWSTPEAAAAVKKGGGAAQPLAAALAEPAAAMARLKRLYGPAHWSAMEALSAAEVAALGLIAAHLEATQGGAAPILKPPGRIGEGQHLLIDPASRASLEIDRTLSGGRAGTLLAAIDRTVTAPGARALAARLARPLTDPTAIGARLDAVGYLLDRPKLRQSVREALAGSGDLARGLSRLTLGRGGPRDLAAVRAGLAVGRRLAALIVAAAEPLEPAPAELTRDLRAVDPAHAPALVALAQALEAGLAPEPPASIRDGGFVQPGCSAELDEARALRDDSRRVISALEGRLVAETGVPLRIRHNGILGYFVETTTARAEPLTRPPLAERFIHRQGLAGQARFTTVELAELDARIARAGEAVVRGEVAIFETWRSQAAASAEALLDLASTLASLDVAAALAQWAQEAGAVRPLINSSRRFEAIGARHPSVEAALAREGAPFTANDCRLDGEGTAGPRMAIVTGPNMAGKSTFLRQNALLVILAQAGSYVPATSLALGVVDRLFSRVGAGDDLARGRSTFMTEMIETAAILAGATDRSFVILDEIGRGTATWDGLAIAWASAEALHETNRCRALFATHFHELAGLERRLAHVGNLSLTAREWQGDLVFLHEARPGAADRSYGVQVAKLAGVPASVVSRAREVLARLERAGSDRPGLETLPLFAVQEEANAFQADDALKAALAELEPDELTPREALEALYRLKALLSRRGAPAPGRL